MAKRHQPYGDPRKYIDQQAKGWLADKLLPFAEFAAKGIEPFDALVDEGREQDEAAFKELLSSDLPGDYRIPKGANENIAEQITPVDIAGLAAPGLTKGAKWLAKNPGVKEVAKFANPLRSEAGTIGDDISKISSISDRLKQLKKEEAYSEFSDAIQKQFKGFQSSREKLKVRRTSPAYQKARLEQLKNTKFTKERFNELIAEAQEKGDLKAVKAWEKLAHEFDLLESKYGTKSKVIDFINPFRSEAGAIGDDISKVGKGKLLLDNDLAGASLRDIGTNPRALGTNKRAATKQPDLTSENKIVEEDLKRAWLRQNPGNIQKTQNPIVEATTKKSIASQSPNNPPPIAPDEFGDDFVPSNPGDNKRPKATLWQNLLGTPKSLKSMIDIPALRQAVVPSLTHPIDVGIPAIKAGLKTEFGPKSVYEDVLEDIAARPNHPIYEKYGFQIPETEIRQQFPASWPEQFEDKLGFRGPVERSEDAYDATLKTARANLADPLIAAAENKYANFLGPGSVPSKEYKGIANYVNDFTGYGTLGQAEKAADLLAAPFYSPRMLTSRFQMLNPWNYGPGNRWGDVGKAAARKDAAKFGAGTVAAGMGLDALSDDIDVTWDPRSSDFASVKTGNTTFDLLGGLRPPINLAARLATGTAKSARADQGEYDIKRGDTIGRFIRSKLGPGIPTMAADVLFGEGKNFIGEPIEKDIAGVPYAGWLADQVTPMYPVDTYEAFDESGAGIGSIAAGLGLLGAGNTSYDRSPRKRAKRVKKASPKRQAR